MTEIVAHRGNSSVAPENTLPALTAGALAGAHYLEIDIQEAADGSAVVLHDESVERTSDGAGVVAEMVAADFKHLDAGSWFDASFANAALPLLGDVLKLMQRFDVDLLLEFKGSFSRESTQTILTQIADAGLTARVLAQTFDRDMLHALHTLAPALRRGLLVHEITDEALAVAAEYRAVACNPSSTSVIADPQVVERVHAANLKLFTWTSNEAAEWAPLVAAGVDGIITDRPDRLAGWLAAQ